MKKALLFIVVIILLAENAHAQIAEKIGPKLNINVSTNIETYFIAEKLAVEHIGNYVFSNRETQYSHQPIVYFALKEFLPWKNSPLILRIAAILKQMRDIQHDNAQQLEYLIYRNSFPKKGFRWSVPASLSLFDAKRYPGSKALGEELADSLCSFYQKANVAAFLKRNKAFYRGAIAEARKHVRANAIPYIEQWYGQQFAGYELYLMPSMPITPGEDNYRAFGPVLSSPNGKVAAMVFSSSVEIPLQKSLSAYNDFGFDNAEVTRLLTVHELSHSFVNPVLFSMSNEIKKDTALFTPKLAKRLGGSYINNWENCLIEHLVRLGEIRIAKAEGDVQEEQRLRRMHQEELGFVLLPRLEDKILEYEQNREKYPDFKSFVPIIFEMLHQLTAEDVDQLL